MEEESASQQEPETPDSGNAPAPAKKGSNTKTWIAVATAIILLLLTIGLGFGLANYDPGEPTPGTRASGSTTCNDWSAAGPGFQKAITDAANKVGIHPALLGSILLSENGDSWPTINMDGPWPHGGKGRGAFQIENWDGFWKQVVEKGYSSDKTGNVESLVDSSLATAVSLRIAFEAKKISPNTTEQKYIIYAAMYHNRGSVAAYEWADDGFDLTKPPANTSHPGWEWGANDYAHRAWNHFQDLSIGCSSSAATNIYTSLAQIKSLFGSTQADVQKHIVSTTFMGKSIQMNKVTIQPLKNAEREIKASGVSYNITSIGGYAWRVNANDSSKMSLHSFGLALDINPPTNPNGPRPKDSGERDPNACTHNIPDAWSKALENNGFFWGAKFKSYCDAMHFQYGGNAY